MPNHQDWSTAAEGFRQQRQSEQAYQYGSPEYEAAVTADTELFENFLNGSQGQAARSLLKASGRHIVLIDHEDGGPHGTVYILDGDGLKCSVEAVGMWVAFAQPSAIKPPTLNTVTPREVIEAGRLRRISANDLVQLIISKANKIADNVPSPKD